VKDAPYAFIYEVEHVPTGRTFISLIQPADDLARAKALLKDVMAGKCGMIIEVRKGRLCFIPKTVLADCVVRLVGAD
jgi:hypothetical protein